MSDAQHTQEKEALEDAANRLLVVNGVALGTLAFTEVDTWVTQDGGKVSGPGYTVAFKPSPNCSAAIAAWLAAQQPPPTTTPPPSDPPPSDPPPADPPPADPPPTGTDAVGALSPGQTFKLPKDA